MSQRVQELIDQIKADGIQAADQKAKEIEGNARTEAQKVIAEAQARARQIVAGAEAQARKIQESTRIALRQSARDALLALRKEIERLLQKIISRQIGDALPPERLADIIGEVVRKSVETKLADDDIRVTLGREDLGRLKDGFIAKLQKEIKQPIQLRPADDMAKGFTISFDEGKSCFDFSDAALAEYLGAYLNTQVAALLKEAT